jgi:protein-L-isoaspartate(D-aspartate) O-methyltransferase
MVTRETMVEKQMRARGLRDERVLRAMGTVQRECFLPPELEDFAYEDVPLPIAEGQTISQPYVVALMLEAADLKASDRVLEVGTGSGYAAACAAALAGEVHTIERHPALARGARIALQAQGFANVHVHEGDGTQGWAPAAPYDAIIVTAGGPVVPASLRRQLKLGGRLIIPVGELEEQRLQRVVRRSETRFETQVLGRVRFVPLVGEEGWDQRPQPRTLSERLGLALQSIVGAVRLPSGW